MKKISMPCQELAIAEVNDWSLNKLVGLHKLKCPLGNFELPLWKRVWVFGKVGNTMALRVGNCQNDKYLMLKLMK